MRTHLALLLALAVGDTLTTIVGMSLGLRELNPIMVIAVSLMGYAGVGLVRLGAAGFIAVALAILYQHQKLTVRLFTVWANAISLAVVLSNAVLIAGVLAP